MSSNIGNAPVPADPSAAIEADPASPAAAEPAAPPVDDVGSDSDSSLGTDQSSTVSLRSSVMRYREENGRTYHAYKDGAYLMPNDEPENDRLDLQHHLFLLTLGGDRLHLAPFSEENPPKRVLDVGTGTGIWACDVGDRYPGAEVIGVDLSPIQPPFAPSNVQFQIDDVEEVPWTYGRKFDFVYSRMMTGGIADFPKLFRQAFENLEAGGWMEVTDITPVTSDDGTLTEETSLWKWADMLLKGTEAVGRSFDGAKLYKRQMEEAGFVNVREVVYKWPQNRWPKDPHYKELGEFALRGLSVSVLTVDLGMWTLEDISSGLEGLSAAVYTRVLGWSKESLDVLLAHVRNDMKNPAIHAYWPM
ncbi:methyltransferase domain-containing protein [Colletotrichum plurivorum]|uniref:Methyltransferase domain-containing protein n=1 Tax=Colletotrichum plurivorum TaxID=2175906 RepID=A0A8H6KGZ2_9PEZI|nr:methyltransferase domain-containing protein [Colletotrichum plurivorum]